ncbi:hypothetical protein GCM10027454_39810 [Algoriphagus aestuariicola]
MISCLEEFRKVVVLPTMSLDFLRSMKYDSVWMIVIIIYEITNISIENRCVGIRVTIKKYRKFIPDLTIEGKNIF